MLDISNARIKRNFGRPWYKPAFELIKKFPKEIKILDLGCGLGEFSSILKNEDFEVFCADGSKKYVEMIKKKRFNASYFDFNEKFPFKSESFDLVISLEVIEHIEKAEEFLSEINRILKPNGYFLVSTPNIAYFGLRLKSLLGFPLPDEGYHFRFFTFKSLKKLLIKNKFKLVNHNSITLIHGAHKLFRCSPIVIKTPFLPNLFALKSIILARKNED